MVILGSKSAMACMTAATLLCSGVSSWASNARNAPTIDSYSALDLGDLYMFRDPPSAPPGPATNLVVVLTVQPLADPSFGPTYHFQPNALYRIQFSTTPDAIARGIATAKIDFVFSPFGNQPACPAPQPPCQTYQATFPQGAVVNGLVTPGTVAATPQQPIITTSGGIKIFAGPREEPFFFDYVGFQRFLADFNAQTPPATPHFNLFNGKDAFLGKNVNAIAVEFPIGMLLPAGATKLAAWAETYLARLKHPGDDHGPSHADDDGLVQVDRLGNPFVNWSLIPPALNDAFDFADPRRDAQDFAPTIRDTLVKYGVDQNNVLPALTTAFIPDTLKFDLNLPDGFLQVPPNGLRSTDRVTDFLITLFFNVTGPVHATNPCPAAQTNFSDCTNAKVPLTAFPFLGPPLQPTP